MILVFCMFIMYILHEVRFSSFLSSNFSHNFSIWFWYFVVLITDVSSLLFRWIITGWWRRSWERWVWEIVCQVVVTTVKKRKNIKINYVNIYLSRKSMISVLLYEKYTMFIISIDSYFCFSSYSLTLWKQKIDLSENKPSTLLFGIQMLENSKLVFNHFYTTFLRTSRDWNWPEI